MHGIRIDKSETIISLNNEFQFCYIMSCFQGSILVAHTILITSSTQVPYCSGRIVSYRLLWNNEWHWCSYITRIYGGNVRIFVF